VHQPCHEIQKELLVSVPGPRAGDEDPESNAELLARIAKPGWAEERAVALMRTGATMPEMIEHLVGKGLSTAEATRIAEKVFEDRVRQQSAPQQRAEQRTWLHRVLSAAIAFSLIVLAWWFIDTKMAAGVTSWLLLFLFFVWYPNWSYFPSNRFNQQTPIVIIRWGGWLLLLAMLIPILLGLLGVLRR
jgi:hypothetical protein